MRADLVLNDDAKMERFGKAVMRQIKAQGVELPSAPPADPDEPKRRGRKRKVGVKDLPKELVQVKNVMRIQKGMNMLEKASGSYFTEAPIV